LNGVQEVAGSNPAGPIILNPAWFRIAKAIVLPKRKCKIEE